MKSINLWMSFFTNIKNKKYTSKLIGKWKMESTEDDFFTERRPSETYEFKDDGCFVHVHYEKRDIRSYTKNYSKGNWKHLQQLDFSCTAENKKQLDLILRKEGTSFNIKGNNEIVFTKVI